MSVSVVIPCFCSRDTIRRAVESVARQTLRPLEIIVVDDASDPATLVELHQLADRFGTNWLRIVELDVNVGAASARNRGWEAARGEHIAFLDADDEWHPRKLEVQADILGGLPNVAVCGHAHVSLKPNQAFPDIDASQAKLSEIPLWSLLGSNAFITPSVILKRDLPFRFRDGQRHMEDHYLWMRIAAAGLRVVKLDLPLAAIFKAEYGDAGLSAQTRAMAVADFGNYWNLWREGVLGLFAAAIFSSWAALKFGRRLMLLGLRDLFSTKHPTDSSRTARAP